MTAPHPTPSLGRIERDAVWCGGRWGARLLAEMGAMAHAEHMTDPRPRSPVLGRSPTSLDELLEGPPTVRPMLHSDSKSGVAFERVLIDGSPHVSSTCTSTTTGRCASSARRRACRSRCGAPGSSTLLPERIDHTVVGVAGGLGRDGLGAAC